jgi:hypothetical protein
VSRISRIEHPSAPDAALDHDEPGAQGGGRRPRRSRRIIWRWPLRPGTGIWLGPAGPVPGGVPGARPTAVVLAVAVTVLAAAQFAAGGPFTTLAWLAIAPLLASLVLPPRLSGLLAGWTVLLALGLAFSGASPGRLGTRLAVLILLAGFAVTNSILRSAAQRRLAQARAVARVAQSALLREVPETVATARLASRYLSASSEARVGGDVLEVVADGPCVRWLVGDTRGKGCPPSGWPVLPPPASATPVAGSPVGWRVAPISAGAVRDPSMTRQADAASRPGTRCQSQVRRMPWDQVAREPPRSMPGATRRLAGRWRRQTARPGGNHRAEDSSPSCRHRADRDDDSRAPCRVSLPGFRPRT